MNPSGMSRVSRRRRCALAGLILCGLAAVPVAAATARAKPAARPDWSGIWENVSGIHFTKPTDSGPNPPPLNAEYAARYKAVTDSAAAGHPLNDPTANCVWPGTPRVIVSPYPSEYLIAPDRVTIVYEYMSQVRRVFTDGRGHPADLDPSYNGHSIGHWEGDALVVDTAGLRADTMYENTGLPHSDALTLRERIRLIGPDTLEDEVTAIDPKAMTRPWVTKVHYKRHRDWQILDYVCEENNRNPVDAKGVTTVKPAGP